MRSRARVVATVAALALLAEACIPEVDVPVDYYPVRGVTPHAYVRNGKAPDDSCQTAPITVFVFDGPVGCNALPDSVRGPVPSGIRLGIVLCPGAWSAGARGDEIDLSAYDDAGNEVPLLNSVMHSGVNRTKTDAAASFELVSAPTANGSRARARFSLRVAFSGDNYHAAPPARVDQIAGDFDVEVCGDLDVGSKG